MLRVLKNVCMVTPVCVAIYDNIGYPALVEGTSMQPTLNPDGDDEDSARKDIVFVNRFVTRHYVVRRNDIVALRSPKDPRQLLVKRVVCVEGDLMRTRKKSYVQIPPGHFWVEGDNADGSSLDSNVFGPVSTGLVVGRATRIIWPVSRWKKLTENDPLQRQPTVRQPLPLILSDNISVKNKKK